MEYVRCTHDCVMDTGEIAFTSRHVYPVALDTDELGGQTILRNNSDRLHSISEEWVDRFIPYTATNEVHDSEGLLWDEPEPEPKIEARTTQWRSAYPAQYYSAQYDREPVDNPEPERLESRIADDPLPVRTNAPEVDDRRNTSTTNDAVDTITTRNGNW